VTTTVDDVLDGFKALWAAAGLPALVTGGIYLRFVPGSVQPPYAWATAESGKQMTTAGPIYLEPFTLTARVYLRNGVDDRREVERRLDTVTRSHGLWPPSRGKAVWVKPAPVPPPPNNAPSQARDIVEVARAWEVLIQQRRLSVVTVG
jgi:hypothetical protein